jgi:asparagine synthase (glutamine-hydrolysing)
MHHFNGMWAFAIYDFQKRKLFCSRDRLGVKPFNYTKLNNELLFASELKALHVVADLTEAKLAKVTDRLIIKRELGQNEVHAYLASFPGSAPDETPHREGVHRNMQEHHAP